MVLLCCLLAQGCARTETRVYTLPQSSGAPATWKGRHVEDVIAAWGEPAERQPDGEGGSLLVYEEKTGVSVSTSQGAAEPPSLEPRPPSAGSTKTESISRVKARFWIDSEGVVYRYWFAPDVYRKGRDDPSRKKPEEKEHEPTGDSGP